MKTFLILALLLPQFAVTLTQYFADGLNVGFTMSATLPQGAVITKAVFDCGGAQSNGWLRGWIAGGSPTKTPIRIGMGGFTTSTDCHYAAPGTYTATLTVTRANGSKASQSSVVTVSAE